MSSLASRSPSSCTFRIFSCSWRSASASRLAMSAPTVLQFFSMMSMRACTAARPSASARSMALICAAATALSSSCSRFLRAAASACEARTSSRATLHLRAYSSCCSRSSSSFLAFSPSSQLSIWSCSRCLRSCSFWRRSCMPREASSLNFFIWSRLAFLVSSSACAFLSSSSLCARMPARSCCFRLSASSRSSLSSPSWPSRPALKRAWAWHLPVRWKSSSSRRYLSASKATMRSQWSIGFIFGRSGT
mmetsp:Transcript_79952/g.226198  ORF Transcript_79952/g.226198 Transcript_79952/m.226198 type:complete len:248 (+) Transcript_79952:506-1249(+)